MFRKILLSSLALSSVLFADQYRSSNAQPIKTPEQIQQELDQAQRDFETAQEMFIPWYTGPLITGSATNVPMGHVNVQPYLYLTLNYAQFNNHRHSEHVPHTYIINPLFVFQTGILYNYLDVTVIPQGFIKWQNGERVQGMGDTNVNFGIQVWKETPYTPNVRLVLGQNFPSGKYTNLDTSKGSFDGIGGGVYSTSAGLNLSKIIWWLPLHPISLRFTTNYVIPDSEVYVENFNTYGGGFGTAGKVRVGKTFNADLGIEVSLNQKWVFATDIAYTYSSKTTFNGDLGVTSTGATATMGSPSSDQLSIAPAIEYNTSPTGGFVGGVWFSVTGRNSANFVSLVLSYTQYF